MLERQQVDRDDIGFVDLRARHRLIDDRRAAARRVVPLRTGLGVRAAALPTDRADQIASGHESSEEQGHERSAEGREETWTPGQCGRPSTADASDENPERSGFGDSADRALSRSCRL